MIRWQADPTVTDPAVYSTTPDEVVTISCDMTALLVDGDPPDNPPPPAKLYRVQSGADVEVPGLPATTVAGNVLAQRISGLTAGEMYRLRWYIVTSGNTRTATTIIQVVE